MEQIKNDPLLLKWFIIGFRKYTGIKYVDDPDQIAFILSKQHGFSEERMLALAKASHTINGMIF